jgi:ElaB/YqjD/DUF883 family membrane-anchored ribosome-binding protein
MTAHSIKEKAAKQAHIATDYVHDRMEDIKDKGTETVKYVEKNIKTKPRRSVAIAFTAGLLASYLLGRRPS